jgi:hypothetical protein
VREKRQLFIASEALPLIPTFSLREKELKQITL